MKGDSTSIVEVTEHAMRRARQRMGIPKRAVVRTVERAWREGRPAADLGTENGFFIACEASDGRTSLVYGGWVFVFNGACCVTIVPARRRPEELYSEVSMAHAREMVRGRRDAVRKQVRRKRRVERSKQRSVWGPR